ncbi:hypothetical protein, partial [Arthrobacter sp. ISL-95]|uniref:hypothetical protein n=1 Tax=Arthrobacter sp. ISL-95 TaxID=2819116 RepID=UPI001BE5C7FE
MTHTQVAATELELVDLDHWGMMTNDDDLANALPLKDIAMYELSENDTVSEYRLTSESLPQEGVPA